jgi:hypothetical protein
MKNMIDRRKMLKTTGLFAISPLVFQQHLKQHPKQLNLDKSQDQNIFFGRNIKRKFNDIDFKPWLHNCNNLRVTTMWNNDWSFEQGFLNVDDSIYKTPPETTLMLSYPNYSLEFKSFDKTWYGSNKPYCDQLPPINGIHIVYDKPPYRLSQHSFDNKTTYIELDNVKLVSVVYMKDCKIKQ